MDSYTYDKVVTHFRCLSKAEALYYAQDFAESTERVFVIWKGTMDDDYCVSERGEKAPLFMELYREVSP